MEPQSRPPPQTGVLSPKEQQHELIKLLFPFIRVMNQKQIRAACRTADRASEAKGNFSEEDYALLLEMRRRDKQREVSEGLKDEIIELNEFNMREKELIRSICSPSSKAASVLDNYVSYNAYRTLKRAKYFVKSLRGEELKPHEEDQFDLSFTVSQRAFTSAH